MAVRAENDDPGAITDHPYEGPIDRPWDRCIHCGIAEAAHVRTATPYVPRSRRCWHGEGAHG